MPQWRLPERIDIAKGPNALLFGTSEPGGVANFNTKRANFTDRTAVAFRVGSWDQYRATLDVNRQLSPNWAARINLVEDSRKNWENWVGSERRAVDLAVTYRLSKNTTLRAVKNPAIIPRGAQFTGPDKDQVTDFHTFGGLESRPHQQRHHRKLQQREQHDPAPGLFRRG
jgi:outer membrane receptor protein involved in Fe transport